MTVVGMIGAKIEACKIRNKEHNNDCTHNNFGLG